MIDLRAHRSVYPHGCRRADGVRSRGGGGPIGRRAVPVHRAPDIAALACQRHDPARQLDRDLLMVEQDRADPVSRPCPMTEVVVGSEMDATLTRRTLARRK